MGERIFIDVDRLREALIDDTGSAMFAASPWAVMDLSDLERAPAEELVREAEHRGWDLRRFEARQ